MGQQTYYFQPVGTQLRFTDNLELLEGAGIISGKFYTYKSARLHAKELAPLKGCSEVIFVGEEQNG